MPAGRLTTCICAKTGGLLVPGSSGPTLPVLTGLAGWWDASDAGSVTLNGGNVAQLNDKSGNNRHMLQATGAAQPIYAAAVRNGLNCLQLDGARWMTPAATWATAALHLFIVMSNTDNSTGTLSTGWSSYALDLQNRNANAATPNLTWAVQTVPGPSGTAFFKTNNTAADSGWHQFDVLNDGVQVDAHMDAGAQWVNPTSWTNGALVAPATPGKLWLGTRNDLATPMKGYIAEVVLYSAALSAGDRTLVRDYLKAKWSTV